jgi:hypothetical protein
MFLSGCQRIAQKIGGVSSACKTAVNALPICQTWYQTDVALLMTLSRSRHNLTIEIARFRTAMMSQGISVQTDNPTLVRFCLLIQLIQTRNPMPAENCSKKLRCPGPCAIKGCQLFQPLGARSAPKLGTRFLRKDPFGPQVWH